MYLLIEVLTSLDKIIPQLFSKAKAEAPAGAGFDLSHVDPDAALS